MKLRIDLKSILWLVCIAFFNETVNAQATFYGTTSGESSELGSIYTLDYKGENYKVIHSFKYDQQGQYPEGAVTEGGNNTLYGLTLDGGDSSEGVLFKYDLTTKAYTVLHHFRKSTGSQPYGKLYGPFGDIFYGTTASGGANNHGTFFQFDISTNTYTLLHSFKQFDDGATPRGRMLLAPNGKIYGTTLFGGTGNNRGTIYSFDTTTKKVVNVHKFTGSGGANPWGAIAISSNGILYGTCNQGGSANRGVIYSFNTNTNSYNVLYSPMNNLQSAQYLRGGVYLENDSKLYGQSVRGGTDNKGVLYSYDITLSSFNILYSFTDSSGNEPQASITKINDSTILGSTTRGGENRRGTVYSFNLKTNTFTKLKDIEEQLGYSSYWGFTNAYNKWFIQFQYGGKGGNGVLREFDVTTNSFATLHNFGTSIEGRDPYYKMLWANNGNLYGVTYSGGEFNSGVLFEIDLATNSYSKKADFNSQVTGYPYTELTEADNGNFYGLSYLESNSYESSIFEYNPTNDSLVLKYEFENVKADGETPLALGKDGKMYGTTSYYNDTGSGVIYSYMPGDTSITVEAVFSESKGEDVEEKLLVTKEGRIFGVAEDGGTNNRGTLFEFILSKKEIEVKHKFVSPSGTDPRGSFIQASNGKLYGTASRGGNNNKSVLFEYDYKKEQYTPLVQFNQFTNNSIRTDLVEGDSGIIFGFMEISSADKKVIFKYDINTDTLIGIDSLSQRISEGLTKTCAPFDGDLIVDKGISLEAKATGDKYQWYNCLDSTAVPEATNKKLIPPSSSTYKAVVAKQGCTYQTNCESLFLLSTNSVDNSMLNVYPNPANNSITVSLNNSANNITSFNIYNNLGQKLIHATTPSVDISILKPGVYYITSSLNGVKYFTKFVKK